MTNTGTAAGPEGAPPAWRRWLALTLPITAEAVIVAEVIIRHTRRREVTQGKVKLAGANGDGPR
jgi:hypothetical protein